MKVSVIIPVYNSANYLDACLNSILDQTYKDLEILIVNDGSTDSSLKICEKYAATDERIKLFSQQNGGQASARNLGLTNATGDLISFIDSDDTVSEDVLSKNVEYFRGDSTIDIVQFPVFFNYGSPRAYLNLQKNITVNGENNLYKYWIEEAKISWIVCDKIFRKNIFDDLKFIERMIYEDNFILVDIFKKTRKLYISVEGIYYYHQRENSTTRSTNSLKKEIDTQAVSLHIFDAINKFKDLKLAKTKMLSRILNVYISIYKNYKVDIFMEIPEEISMKCISYRDIYSSNIPVKEKIKLFLAKFVEVRLYLKLNMLIPRGK